MMEIRSGRVAFLAVVTITLAFAAGMIWGAALF